MRLIQVYDELYLFPMMQDKKLKLYLLKQKNSHINKNVAMLGETTGKQIRRQSAENGDIRGA
jgi:hypothetical protein